MKVAPIFRTATVVAALSIALTVVATWLVFSGVGRGTELDTRLRQRTASFELGCETRKRNPGGGECNSLLFSKNVDTPDSVHEAAQCSHGYLKDSLRTSERSNEMREERVLSDVARLLESTEKMVPAECVGIALDVLSISRAMANGASFGRAATANRRTEQAIRVGLTCLARMQEGMVAADLTRLSSECTRPPYAASVIEWQLLHAAYSLTALYAQRPFIPRFWDAHYRQLTTGRTLLWRSHEVLSAVEQVHGLASTQYPLLTEKLEQVLSSLGTSQADLKPFGAASLKDYNVVGMELREVALVRAFTCAIAKKQSGYDSPCPTGCDDPYTGQALKTSGSKPPLVYSVGRNGRDDGGKGDDRGVQLPRQVQ